MTEPQVKGFIYECKFQVRQDLVDALIHLYGISDRSMSLDDFMSETVDEAVRQGVNIGLEMLHKTINELTEHAIDGLTEHTIKDAVDQELKDLGLE